MHSWLITSDEDDRLHGITTDAQVIYIRGLRKYMDFETGLAGEKGSTITHQSLKRLIEYIPEWGSNAKNRTFKDVSTHYIRARLAELERAGLIEKLPKENKFEHLIFFLPLAKTGLIRLKKEPQRNRKGTRWGEPQGEKEKNEEISMLSDGKEKRNRGGEPQGEGKRNRNNTGIQDITSFYKDVINTDTSSLSKKLNGKECFDVFNYWKSVMGHPQSQMLDKRKKLIQKTLDSDYTTIQLKLAIDGHKKSKWHMENGFDGIEYSLKTENIDKFIRLAGMTNGELNRTSGVIDWDDTSWADGLQAQLGVRN